MRRRWEGHRLHLSTVRHESPPHWIFKCKDVLESQDAELEVSQGSHVPKLLSTRRTMPLKSSKILSTPWKSLEILPISIVLQFVVLRIHEQVVIWTNSFAQADLWIRSGQNCWDGFGSRRACRSIGTRVGQRSVPELMPLVREPNRLWSQGDAAYSRSRASHLPLQPPLFGLELDLIGKIRNWIFLKLILGSS